MDNNFCLVENVNKAWDMHEKMRDKMNEDGIDW